ncbi:hypothetical protein ACMGDK_11555 [Chryseobacterium sp. DT-3]|uniref:hypothetical protein n=1 Tax=Chryseobacterium sp. DT-3 TaxID=3396164 RepID=UPI003F1D1E80
MENSKSSIQERKENLIREIKAMSAWTSRSPQEQEFNNKLATAIGMISVACENAEKALSEYKPENSTEYDVI